MNRTTCGYMPTFRYVQDCISNMSSCSHDFSYSTAHSCIYQNDTLIVVDTSCPGCGLTLAHQNIWHIMTKVFSAWTAKIMLNTTTSVKFISRPPNGGMSKELWAVVGSTTHDSATAFCKVVVLKRNKAPPVSSRVWYSRARLPDRLWSLSAERHFCHRSSARFLWRAFVASFYRKYHVVDDNTARNDCLLLRRPMHLENRALHTKVKRIEANISAFLKRNPSVVPIYFHSQYGLANAIIDMKRCRRAIGIHGAQMMNIMWMNSGGSVVEHEYAKSINYYYKNIAELTGLRHVTRTICTIDSARCDSFLTPHGVVLKTL